MSRPTQLYLVLAFAAAALCVRLGVWQLNRLRERRARNAAIMARLAAPPEPPQALRADTTALRYRRAHVAGRADYRREVVLAYRMRQGAPGVQVLTPLHVGG